MTLWFGLVKVQQNIALTMSIHTHQGRLVYECSSVYWLVLLRQLHRYDQHYTLNTYSCLKQFTNFKSNFQIVNYKKQSVPRSYCDTN